MSANSNNNGKRYANRRAVLLPRTSTKVQDISIDDQLDAMRAFCKRNDITEAGVIGDAGISASKPWARSDIEEVVNRKKVSNDFDLVVVYDVDRFSRGGPIIGSRELGKLWDEDIDVIPICVEIFDDHYGETQWIQALTISNGHARNQSNAVTRGIASSRKDGRSLPSRRMPFGTDRLIRCPERRPKHIVRVLRNGWQVVLDPDTGDEIERFPPKRNGTGNRYRKQKHDYEELCPGHPDDVELLREIFRHRYIDDWSIEKITEDLNLRGIPGITGGVWCKGTIRNLLKNPSYVGFVVANQSSRAIYFRCGSIQPEEVERTLKMRSGKEGPSLYIRPVEDHLEIPQPLIKSWTPDVRFLGCHRDFSGSETRPSLPWSWYSPEFLSRTTR